MIFLCTYCLKIQIYRQYGVGSYCAEKLPKFFSFKINVWSLLLSRDPLN